MVSRAETKKKPSRDPWNIGAFAIKLLNYSSTFAGFDFRAHTKCNQHDRKAATVNTQSADKREAKCFKRREKEQQQRNMKSCFMLIKLNIQTTFSASKPNHSIEKRWKKPYPRPGI